MPEFTFVQFFEWVKTACFTVEDFLNGLFGFIGTLSADQHLKTLSESVWAAIGVVVPFLPYIGIALALIVAFAGKRLFSVLRFLAFFSFGFVLGVHFLTPLISVPLPMIPTWVIGLVTGIVAAVLSKLLYFLAYIGVAFYAVYYICLNGTVIPAIAPFTQGNYIVAIVAGAVAVVVVLLLRKFIEMLGTAMLGGWGVASVVLGIWNYTALPVFVGREWLGVLVATLIVALVGFVVQFKTRRRY